MNELVSALYPFKLGRQHKRSNRFQVVISTTKKNKAVMDSLGWLKETRLATSSSPGLRRKDCQLGRREVQIGKVRTKEKEERKNDRDSWSVVGPAG